MPDHDPAWSLFRAAVPGRRGGLEQAEQRAGVEREDTCPAPGRSGGSAAMANPEGDRQHHIDPGQFRRWRRQGLSPHEHGQGFLIQ